MSFGITDGLLKDYGYVIEPHGEIDLVTAHELKARLLEAVDEGRRFILVDLDDVHFIDSTGLGVLLSVQRKLQQVSGTLMVVRPQDTVRRVFDITSLWDPLRVRDSREEAATEIAMLAADTLH